MTPDAGKRIADILTGLTRACPPDILRRPMGKKRLDGILVDRKLAPTRVKAQALIMAGQVFIESELARKPGAMIDQRSAIHIKERPPYVSRGGEKLDHGLSHFRLDIAGMAAADIGASTGGFTDCLLQHGARRVYAVDVGYGQLDYRLRNDPRVGVLERVNIRHLKELPELVDIATVDVSFISLELVLPAVTRLLKPNGLIVALFKPQFQAQKQEVGRGGVIRSPHLHARLIGRFVSWAANQDIRFLGLTPSPLLGPAGNKEFLLLLRPGRVVGSDNPVAGNVQI